MTIAIGSFVPKGRLGAALQHLSLAAWPLIDQGVVSLAAFGVTVVFARGLPAAEYGAFAILISTLMTLQVFTSSLLFYPMSVQGGTAGPSGQREGLRSGYVLLSILLVPLLATIVLVTRVMGRSDLCLPGLVYFAAWQVQEGLRRGLFCELRHKDAIAGDAISYVGQLVLVAALWRADALTLPHGIYAMAATALLGACVHARRVALTPGRVAVWRTGRRYMAIGGWSLLNNLLGAMRVLPLMWILGAGFGPGASASLQALLNVINLTNPVLIGLTNVLPQVTARARHRGVGQAWRAAWPYVASGSPIVLGFALVLLVAPGSVLRSVYGTASPYAGLDSELRILTVFVVAGYLVEMACAVLHGLNLPQRALTINAVGALATLVISVPLTLAYGLAGTCLAVAIGAALRLLASIVLVNGLVSHGSRSSS